VGGASILGSCPVAGRPNINAGLALLSLRPIFGEVRQHLGVDDANDAQASEAASGVCSIAVALASNSSAISNNKAMVRASDTSFASRLHLAAFFIKSGSGTVISVMHSNTVRDVF
jgi:hypothetical protein